jgi:hypothetical protein
VRGGKRCGVYSGLEVKFEVFAVCSSVVIKEEVCNQLRGTGRMALNNPKMV